MRKYLVVLFLMFCTIIYAQENYKGKVAFVFNGEKIELPISVISLRKESKIHISIRAERNNNEKHQLIGLEWDFDKLSTDDKDLNVYDNFLLNVVNNSKDEKDELRFKMNKDAEENEILVRQGHRTWQLTSLSLKFNIENVSFEKPSLRIEGSLSFKAYDAKSEDPLKSISEVDNCRFEIVI